MHLIKSLPEFRWLNATTQILKSNVDLPTFTDGRNAITVGVELSDEEVNG
jgi:hypothetical protein